MNIVKLHISIAGNVAELPVVDRDEIFAQAIKEITKYCERGDLRGVKLHVNSILEFPTEEQMTFFLLTYNPLVYEVWHDGSKILVRVEAEAR